MPPSRTASSSKRKASKSEDLIATTNDNGKEEESPSRPTVPSKKSKADSSAAKEATDRDVEHTNKTIPESIDIPEKNDGCWRIASWNVSGLAASQKKGFKNYVEAEDPDILIITETKMNNEPVDPFLSGRFPHRYWSIADKKGYAGTAVLSKHKPISVDMTLPGHPIPSSIKGRLVSLEYEKFFLVATYVVNAGQDLKTLNEKNEWNKHFEIYIRNLEKLKPIIWAGDLNVAPTEMDLSNAKRNWNKSAGYTEDETSAFRRILSPTPSVVASSTSTQLENIEKNGESTSLMTNSVTLSSTSESAESLPSSRRIDIWRHLHPGDRQYTYFSYRFSCREKGIGWRIDMFVISEMLLSSVKLCEIRRKIYGASDHVPIVLEILP